jgi:peptide/nickel transport system permease protein
MLHPWLSRLAQYAVVLWVTLTLNFILPRVMPGNPLALLAGAEVTALTADERSMLLSEAGLDRPLTTQYLHYLGNLARGDLGYSYQRHEPVTAVLASRLPWTLLLTVSSSLAAVLLGLVFGALAARHHGRPVDAGLLGTFMLLESLPVFWVGMVLIALVAVQVPLFPTFGAVTTWIEYRGIAWVVDVAHHLVLPLVTLTVATVSSTFLVARAAISTVLSEPFIRAARAKGVTGTRLLVRHVLPNVLVPVVTVFGMNLAFAVGGATLVETVFSYPGVGRLVYEAVLSRDYPVLQAAFLMITLVVLLANLVIDACYPWLDPRLRTSRSPASGGRA